MFKTLVNAWKVPELRRKILFTVAILVVYRFGNAVPIPFIDATALTQLFADNGENVFYGYLNLLTGGSFTSCTIFALSITPYITASIIVQLLTMAIPALERMVKEGGEEGRKKQAKIMRYAAVGLGLLEGFVYYLTLQRNNIIAEGVFFAEGGTADKIFVAAIVIMTFAAGTAVVMWLGELINDHGIGNGISMILFAGILSRIPTSISAIAGFLVGEEGLKVGNLVIAIVMAIVGVFMVGFVVWVEAFKSASNFAFFSSCLRASSNSVATRASSSGADMVFFSIPVLTEISPAPFSVVSIWLYSANKPNPTNKWRKRQ